MFQMIQMQQKKKKKEKKLIYNLFSYIFILFLFN